MKISVVIPAYNASGSLSKAIESCIKQTLKPHEIIVVDDASRDNTIEIAKQYPGITLLPLEQNAGPSKARNTGWEAATGDIIAFLDVDDTWDEVKIQKLNDAFTSGKFHLLAHSYNIKGRPQRVESERQFRVSYFSILLSNPCQPSCMAVHREVPLRFDESYRYCEDHEFALRMANKYECYFLDEALTTLGRPQLTSGGASANRWKMRKGELRLYTSIYKHNMVYIVFIPLLWIYSLGKMLMRSLLH